MTERKVLDPVSSLCFPFRQPPFLLIFLLSLFYLLSLCLFVTFHFNWSGCTWWRLIFWTVENWWSWLCQTNPIHLALSKYIYLSTRLSQNENRMKTLLFAIGNSARPCNSCFGTSSLITKPKVNLNLGHFEPFTCDGFMFVLWNYSNTSRKQWFCIHVIIFFLLREKMTKIDGMMMFWDWSEKSGSLQIDPVYNMVKLNAAVYWSPYKLS